MKKIELMHIIFRKKDQKAKEKSVSCDGSCIAELVETLEGIVSGMESWPLNVSEFDKGIAFGLRIAIQEAEKQERKNEQKNG